VPSAVELELAAQQQRAAAAEDAHGHGGDFRQREMQRRRPAGAQPWSLAMRMRGGSRS
jgi:hypothetical protein